MKTVEELQLELAAAQITVSMLRGELHAQKEREERQSAEAAGKTNHHGFWRSDGSCSYCGSMTTAEAIRRLTTNGTRYSGADWKYGYPHKFYIELGAYPHKFYNDHLMGASDAEFQTFSALSSALLHISWRRDSEQGLQWEGAPGTQEFGTIELEPTAPPPGVDRSARVLSDGKPETADHCEINPATGQQKGYIVLSAAERAKGFVRPVRREYTHTTCGSHTIMAVSIAETYARDPQFYNGTFCCHCREHYPLDQFVWKGTTEQVGS